MDIRLVALLRFLGLRLFRLGRGVRFLLLFVCRRFLLSQTLVVSLIGPVDEAVQVLGELLECRFIDRRDAGDIGRFEHEDHAVINGIRLRSHFSRRRQIASVRVLDTLQIELFAFPVGRLQFREGRREAQRGHVRSVLGFLQVDQQAIDMRRLAVERLALHPSVAVDYQRQLRRSLLLGLFR